ncbi:MAG: flagellar regulator YcgR PilZN domain-containing protein [Pseudomonadota bacterium]
MSADERFLLRKPRQIQSLIRSLAGKHHLVRIFPSGSADAGVAFISGMLSNREAFLIDAVQDKAIHQAICGGATFTMEASIDGVELRIPGLEVDDIVGDLEDQRYKIQVPSEVYYHQRRRLERTAVPGSASISATLMVPRTDDKSLYFDECDVYNISANGCAISMSDNAGRVVSRVAGPLTLSFSVDTWTSSLDVMAVKRHHRLLSRTMQWQMGFQFVNPSAEVQDRFERLIACLQIINSQQMVMG